MTTSHGQLSELVFRMLEDGAGKEQIETNLFAQGYEESFVKEFVTEAIKHRNLKRRSHALLLILCGAVICFASFILTITSSFSHDSFPWILYGLTTIGIVVVFAGFMKVF